MDLPWLWIVLCLMLLNPTISCNLETEKYKLENVGKSGKFVMISKTNTTKPRMKVEFFFNLLFCLFLYKKEKCDHKKKYAKR